jgi:hypothetical protein
MKIQLDAVDDCRMLPAEKVRMNATIVTVAKLEAIKVVERDVHAQGRRTASVGLPR